MLECGPDSFLSAKPAALTLIKELGLEGDVIGSNDHQRITYILNHGKLVRAARGRDDDRAHAASCRWSTSPLLGWGTKIRMGLEYFREARRASRDRSVAEFVTDHFGHETLDYLAEPLLSGVYGGDPDKLSVASVLPRFVEMERTKGSLARALMTAAESARSRSRAAVPHFEERPGMPGRQACGEGERRARHGGSDRKERELGFACA